MKKRILTLIPDSGDAHRQKGVDNKCLQQAFQLSEELKCVAHACVPAKTRSKKSNDRFLSVRETIATDIHRWSGSRARAPSNNSWAEFLQCGYLPFDLRSQWNVSYAPPPIKRDPVNSVMRHKIESLRLVSMPNGKRKWYLSCDSRHVNGSWKKVFCLQTRRSRSNEIARELKATKERRKGLFFSQLGKQSIANSCQTRQDTSKRRYGRARKEARARGKRSS